MFSCAVCGCKQSRMDLADEVFNIDGEYVLVEHIPVEVCVRCGEQSVSIDTSETVRLSIKGGAAPTRSIQMLVFEFAAVVKAGSADVIVP